MQVSITKQTIRNWEKEADLPYDLFWLWLEEVKRPLQKDINQWLDFRLSGFLSRILERDSLTQSVFVPFRQGKKQAFILLSKNVGFTGTENSQKELSELVQNLRKINVEKVLVSPESTKPVFFDGNISSKISFHMAL